MSVHKCSLCNRPAAWQICEELFCEVDKEKIVERFGIDIFSMKRLSSSEKDFTVRGRYKQPVQAVSSFSPENSKRKQRAR
ncbi:hypothetical protein EDE15_4189 [Edaphobacter aggregans]|uniref:Uncharacterized protein n=1 Tax=Edaphobacter aggregans TaxID=570835 RepID=A0A428MNY1_9BACT|nr:hypothetical protein EDE15_4189 [Edaphobacter aggregans]